MPTLAEKYKRVVSQKSAVFTPSPNFTPMHAMVFFGDSPVSRPTQSLQPVPTCVHPDGHIYKRESVYFHRKRKLQNRASRGEAGGALEAPWRSRCQAGRRAPGTNCERWRGQGKKCLGNVTRFFSRMDAPTYRQFLCFHWTPFLLQLKKTGIAKTPTNVVNLPSSTVKTTNRGSAGNNDKTACHSEH